MLPYDPDVLSKLGLKLTHIIPALIGGALAIIFGKRRYTTKEKLKGVGIVILGAVSTGYITPIILSWQPQWESIEASIGFVVGIFGMGIIEAALNLVQELIIDPIGTIKKLFSLKK